MKQQSLMDNDVYYILITVIFGLFVLFMVWWLYRYTKRPDVLTMNREDLTDEHKALLYRFCESKRLKKDSKKKQQTK